MPNFEREINELHAFFVDWFTAKLPHTPEGFARFDKVTHPNFHVINPAGVLAGGTDLKQVIYDEYDQRHDFRIWIENVAVQHAFDNIVVATYEEWQEIKGETTARLSTVVFTRDDSKPNGLVWQCVHETWLPINET